MPKKPSGLGRGLGDLLEDNAPTLRTQQPSVIIRTGQSGEVAAPQKLPNSLYEIKTKPLFETKPRNKSLK
jgi:hypothetical protein